MMSTSRNNVLDSRKLVTLSNKSNSKYYFDEVALNKLIPAVYGEQEQNQLLTAICQAFSAKNHGAQQTLYILMVIKKFDGSYSLVYLDHASGASINYETNLEKDKVDTERKFPIKELPINAPCDPNRLPLEFQPIEQQFANIYNREAYEKTAQNLIDQAVFHNKIVPIPLLDPPMHFDMIDEENFHQNLKLVEARCGLKANQISDPQNLTQILERFDKNIQQEKDQILIPINLCRDEIAALTPKIVSPQEEAEKSKARKEDEAELLQYIDEQTKSLNEARLKAISLLESSNQFENKNQEDEQDGIKQTRESIKNNYPAYLKRQLHIENFGNDVAIIKAIKTELFHYIFKSGLKYIKDIWNQDPTSYTEAASKHISAATSIVTSLLTWSKQDEDEKRKKQIEKEREEQAAKAINRKEKLEHISKKTLGVISVVNGQISNFKNLYQLKINVKELTDVDPVNEKLSDVPIVDWPLEALEKLVVQILKNCNTTTYWESTALETIKKELSVLNVKLKEEYKLNYFPFLIETSQMGWFDYASNKVVGSGKTFFSFSKEAKAAESLAQELPVRVKKLLVDYPLKFKYDQLIHQNSASELRDRILPAYAIALSNISVMSEAIALHRDLKDYRLQLSTSLAAAKSQLISSEILEKNINTKLSNLTSQLDVLDDIESIIQNISERCAKLKEDINQLRKRCGDIHSELAKDEGCIQNFETTFILLKDTTHFPSLDQSKLVPLKEARTAIKQEIEKLPKFEEFKARSDELSNIDSNLDFIPQINKLTKDALTKAIGKFEFLDNHTIDVHFIQEIVDFHQYKLTALNKTLYENPHDVDSSEIINLQSFKTKISAQIPKELLVTLSNHIDIKITTLKNASDSILGQQQCLLNISLAHLVVNTIIDKATWKKTLGGSEVIFPENQKINVAKPIAKLINIILRPEFNGWENNSDKALQLLTAIKIHLDENEIKPDIDKTKFFSYLNQFLNIPHGGKTITPLLAEQVKKIIGLRDELNKVDKGFVKTSALPLAVKTKTQSNLNTSAKTVESQQKSLRNVNTPDNFEKNNAASNPENNKNLPNLLVLNRKIKKPVPSSFDVTVSKPKISFWKRHRANIITAGIIGGVVLTLAVIVATGGFALLGVGAAAAITATAAALHATATVAATSALAIGTGTGAVAAAGTGVGMGAGALLCGIDDALGASADSANKASDEEKEVSPDILESAQKKKEDRDKDRDKKNSFRKSPPASLDADIKVVDKPLVVLEADTSFSNEQITQDVEKAKIEPVKQQEPKTNLSHLRENLLIPSEKNVSDVYDYVSKNFAINDKVSKKTLRMKGPAERKEQILATLDRVKSYANGAAIDSSTINEDLVLYQSYAKIVFQPKEPEQKLGGKRKKPRVPTIREASSDALINSTLKTSGEQQISLKKGQQTAINQPMVETPIHSVAANPAQNTFAQENLFKLPTENIESALTETSKRMGLTYSSENHD